MTDPEVDFDEQLRTTNQVVVTGALGVGIDFAEEHRVEVTGLYLRNTEDDASLTTGHNTNFAQSSGLGIRNYRIRFEERELELLQFRGTHTVGDATLDLLGDWLEFAKDARIEWYYRTPRRTPTSRARCDSRR